MHPLWLRWTSNVQGFVPQPSIDGRIWNTPGGNCPVEYLRGDDGDRLSDGSWTHDGTRDARNAS